MKKLLLVLVLLLVGVVVANAQLRFGVKGGINISSLTSDDARNKEGFGGGFFCEYKIANFAVQPEILFSMQGANYREVMRSGGHSYYRYIHLEYNYINIPIMAKYYVVPGLSIEAGPQVGFLISAKYKEEDEKDLDMKENTKKTDFAVCFGLSYELPAIPVGVYARYSLGVSNINDNDSFGYDVSKSGNRVFNAGLFVKF